MPEGDVTLTANYTEVKKPDPEEPDKPENPDTPETKSYKLNISGADVTLADGTPVDDLTAVPEGTRLIATAYPDTSAEVFLQWLTDDLELTEDQLTARELEFTMPGHDVILTTVTRNPDTASDERPDSAATFIVLTAGGAAIGTAAYFFGTTAYLKSVLPEGMAIPADREQLAAALWIAAGKPQTQSTAVFCDVPAENENLQAIRWAVDTGLLAAETTESGTFFLPNRHVTRVEVIRTWNNFQQHKT